MRIENTDRFRNKKCKVIYKDGSYSVGKVFFIPNYSAKYDYHDVGWFQEDLITGDLKLNFKDIYQIDVIEGDANV